jgi:hypothetical protein
MMVALAPENARDSATIRRVYRDHLDLLFLGAYTDLEGALATGGLAPLPNDPRAFNIVPRLQGLHPIGEKDMRHQYSYVAARPATVGALLELASRVRSGPLEITSLVRHGEYQDALRKTNANAATAVPMHTMGLAFDVALINTPLRTVYEIRDVLREMRDEGDILFIGERRQLVFHVVPHPARIGHFSDVYTRAIGAPSASQAAVVIAQVPGMASDARGVHVVTEVVSIVPRDEELRGIWAALADAGTEASAAPPAEVETLSANVGVTLAAGAVARSLLALLAAVAAAMFRILARYYAPPLRHWSGLIST